MSDVTFAGYLFGGRVMRKVRKKKVFRDRIEKRFRTSYLIHYFLSKSAKNEM